MSSTVRSPEEAAQRQLEAYNARDAEQFASAYATDVEVFELPSGTRTLAGRAELRTRYSALFAASPRLLCRLVARIVQGSFGIDHEEVSGLRGGPLAHALAVYEVLGGFIRRVWFLRSAP